MSSSADVPQIAHVEQPVAEAEDQPSAQPSAGEPTSPVSSAVEDTVVEIAKDPADFVEFDPLSAPDAMVVTGQYVIGPVLRGTPANVLKGYFEVLWPELSTNERLDQIATLLAGLTISQQSDVIDRADRMRETPQVQPVTVEAAD
jgi:hypothetical protein